MVLILNARVKERVELASVVGKKSVIGSQT